MSGIIHDAKAKKLEDADLWRRAAGRWLEVMYRHECNDMQREWVRQRRKHCLSMVKLSPEPNILHLGTIAKAAADTLARMTPDSPENLIFYRKKLSAIGSDS